MRCLRVSVVLPLWLVVWTLSGSSSAAAQAGLTFGLPAADEFTLTTPGGHFEAVIPISTGANPVTFRLRAGLLRSTSGDSAAVHQLVITESGKTLTDTVRLSKFDGADLRLSADLPRPGTYRGGVTIITEGERKTHPFTISWKPLAQPVEIGLVGTIPVTVGPIGGDDSVTVPFTLRDTAGTRLSVRPVLDSLRRAEGDYIFAAVPKTVVLRGVTGDTAGKDSTVPIEPNRSYSNLRLVVRGGFTHPGTYHAALRVEGAGVSGYSVPLLFYARRSGWIAGLLILLGIAVTEFLRWYNDLVRPRLGRQRRAAALLEELGAVEKRLREGRELSDDEREVLQGLVARLTAVYHNRVGESLPAPDEILRQAAEQMGRVERWAELRRRIDALPEPGLRNDVAQLLTPTLAYLTASNPTDQQRTEADSALQETPGKLKEKQLEYLKQEIDKLRTRLEQEGTASAAIMAALEEAKKHAEVQDLNQASAAFDRARGAYIDLWVAELRSRLSDNPPGWIEQPPRWEQTRARVSSQLDAIPPPGAELGSRLAATESAQRTYIVELASTLKEAATKKLTETPTDDQRALLERAAAGAEQAVILADTDLGTAIKDFKAAEKAWIDYRATKPAALQAGGQAVPAEERAFEFLTAGVAPRLSPLPVVPVGTFAPSSLLEARIGCLDVLMSGVAAALAIAFGVALLWAPNPTWGSPEDLTAAFLWGLGLQQAGNETLRAVATFLGRARGHTATPGG